VGSGLRFLSGISYYTLRLSNALAQEHAVSVILMRQLLPTFLYPGRDRVGAPLTPLRYASNVSVCDGVDWYWLPSLFRALAMLLKRAPEVVVFQWWTSTVIHSYLAIALVARILGARLIVEFHEVIDPGEARIWPVRRYVGLLAPLLMKLAAGFVVHSAYDRELLGQRYSLAGRPVAEIPHGPYNHYRLHSEQQVLRPAPADTCNLLFFGTIRPYKGLEDLIRAFDALEADEIGRYWLSVVGETWEGWTLPAELIRHSRYASRISFVNRYVTDQDVAAYFAGADAVVLPYLRSSASGPLHVAMSHGIPTVVTRVGGLTEAASRYPGALLVEPGDPDALREALRHLPSMRGQRYADPHSWERSVQRYDELFSELGRERFANAH
jgi:glycosyltransferase involved in cell wall biosynthesis